MFRVAADDAFDERAVGDMTYSVEVEANLPFRADRVARFVGGVLADRRGWRTALGIEMERVGGERDPDLRILVATPSTTDELCAPLQTRGEVSCRNGALVVLNARRWASGIPDYRGRLTEYRTYLVNHETGHALGQAHADCPGADQRAPVMMQQTYGLGECSPNWWPLIDP